MKLEYFKNKVCTVFTTTINRDYKEENPKTYPQQMHLYFMGFVREIDDKGLWLEQISQDRLMSYFFFHNIVGIAEEKILDAEHDKEIIEKIQKEMVAVDPNEQQPNIDVGFLEKLKNQTATLNIEAKASGM